MIVIIGNGIAGTTCARNVRKQSDLPITIISSESKYFFSRTALMYVFMGHMKFEHTQPYEPHFWEDNNINLIQDHVLEIDTTSKKIITKTGDQIQYEKLIIASGSKPNKFGWKGQDADGVGGLYSKQDLEYLEKRSGKIKKVVIVGGGLIGIELAEMCLSRNMEVHFLVREKTFWGGVLPSEDAEFIMHHLTKHHGLNMHYEEELEEILTDSTNTAVGIKTKSGKQIDCQFVGLTTGVSPNIDLIKDSKIETDRGILVNRSFETSEKNVYAIGDCAEFRNPAEGRQSIEQVWYTGKIMGETLADIILGKTVEYNPGHWFNSAKFFDIEYQTYGQVQNKLLEEQEEFVYKHPNEKILLHFVFEDQKFIGINAFGIRLRHALFNEWLLRGATIEEVLINLKTANFDPELYARYEDEIVAQFNAKFGTTIKVAKAKWWQKLMPA